MVVTDSKSRGRSIRRSGSPTSGSLGTVGISGSIPRRVRNRLVAQGAEFTSETDAEVIAHLVAHHYKGDLAEAVRAAYGDLRGHYAFVAISAEEPGVLVGARKECPLIVGRGQGEQFIASAI